MTEYKHLLTPRNAADYIGVMIGTPAVWRCTHRYAIPYVKVSRRIKYREEDLNEY